METDLNRSEKAGYIARNWNELSEMREMREMKGRTEARNDSNSTTERTVVLAWNRASYKPQ